MKLKVQILTTRRKFYSNGQVYKDALYWETLDIDVTEDDTVEEVKKKVGDVGGWDLTNEPLVLGSNALKTDSKMKDVGVQDGSLVVIGVMEVVISITWDSSYGGFPLVKMIGLFVSPGDTIGGLVNTIRTREKLSDVVKVILKHGDEKLNEEKTLAESSIGPDTALILEFD